MVDEKLVEECVEAAIGHISSCLEPPHKIEDWFARNLVREIVIVSLGTAMQSAREVDEGVVERVRSEVEKLIMLAGSRVTPAEASAARKAVDSLGTNDALRELVMAAREAAFGGHFAADDPDAIATMLRLDKASEAFADRYPWEGQPEMESHP